MKNSFLLKKVFPLFMVLSAGVTLAQAATVYEYRVPLKGLTITPLAENEGETPSAPDSVVLALRGEDLPQGTVGLLYPVFDFKSLLTLTGGNPLPPLSAVSWEVSGALPPGLSLDESTGVLSGVPTVKNETGASFEIVATYQDAKGRQVFTIIVDGVTLDATQLSAGTLHTCAITTTGGVKCWGFNDQGQLGDGSTDSKFRPTDVYGLSGSVVAISAGNRHTCAITATGGVVCWGQNNYGQLGDGTTTRRTTPVAVSGLSGSVASVSAGSGNTCVVTSAGAAMCWGYNYYGQLGNGTTTNQSTPTLVSGLSSGVSSISAKSDGHTCAVTQAGGVKCWGWQGDGRLGNGNVAGVSVSSPVQVSGLESGVKSVSVGNAHTCAVTTAGAAMCWGYNYTGQLGDNSKTSRATPVVVSGLGASVSSISASVNYTCAVHDGAAKCWGGGGSYQLGTGWTIDIPSPMLVTGLGSGVTQISTGSTFACATHNDVLKCWGTGAQGQIGDGSTGSRPAPTEVQF